MVERLAHRQQQLRYELYDGYTWHKAYYLQPYGLQDLTLTSEDGSVEKSVAYQNPFWPTQASEGALE